MVRADASRPRQRRGLFEKLHAAFRTFFPARPAASASRLAAKNRLRMILVADRCALAPESVTEMRNSIVEALADYVEIENNDVEGGIDLTVSTDPELGTIYSVSVPVKSVRSRYRDDNELGREVGGYDGVDIKWEQ